MVKDTVTMPKDIYEMMVDIIKEHTALMDAIFRENMYPRFYKETCCGKDVVRCQMYKFELKGD